MKVRDLVVACLWSVTSRPDDPSANELLDDLLGPKGTYPEFLEVRKVCDILDLLNHIVSDIQHSEFLLLTARTSVSAPT